MPLTTENAGAVVAGSAPAKNANEHLVEVIIGTFIKSVGRDTMRGEILKVGTDDYRFLKPYGFVKDAEEKPSKKKNAEDK